MLVHAVGGGIVFTLNHMIHNPNMALQPIIMQASRHNASLQTMDHKTMTVG